MKIKIVLILLLLISSERIFSQEKSESNGEIIIEVPENGKIENGTYICNRFDWKIEIPIGYEITSIKRVEELEKKGYEAIKNELPNGTNVRQNRPHLIGFGIDKRNNFSSSFETLEGTKKMTLEENRDFLAVLLSDTYSKIEALKFELNKSDLKIGKYDFYKIQVKLYNAKTDELLLTQDLYNCFMQNNLFSASLNYTSEDVRKLLTENFIKSLSK